MIRHLKSRIWDGLLCVCLSVGLAWSLFSGFLLEDGLYQNVVLVAVITLGIIFLLELFSYNRTFVRAGVASGIVLLIGYLVYIRMNNIWSDETAHSLGVTCTLIVGASLFVYLTSRTRVGILVLFAAGNIVMCGAHFLQFPVHVWNFLLFTFTVFLMFLYRSYLATLMMVESGTVRIAQYMRQAAFLCVLCFLIALGAYFGLIQRINPPTKDLYLITKLENMDLMKVLGISSVRELLDPSMLSGENADQLDYTNQMEQEKQEQSEEEESEEEQNPEEEDNLLSTIRYDISRIRIPWLMLIMLAMGIAAWVWFKQRRKRWLKQLADLSKEAQILNLYHYFLKKYGRAGWKKPAHYTLYEYADNMEYEMELFITEGISFLDLTDIYVRTVYGGGQATDKDMEAYLKFYHAFDQNMIREFGKMYYIRKFLWI